MPTITAGGTPQTISLPEGKVLLLTGAAGTDGVAYRLNQALGGTNSLQSWAVGAGALAPIGPYEGTNSILITCTAGSIAAVVREAVLSLSAGSGAPASIPFSAAVPLASSSIMSRQIVTGPIAFSPMGAVSGASCIAELVANGANPPTYLGFEEHSSSSGWVNTAGYTNLIQFFVVGSRAYYSISQPINQAVVTPATAITASGPSTGVTGAASGAFTLSLSPTGSTAASAVTVTPSAAGCTFTPASVSLTTAAPTATFTVNAASDGAKTINFANNGALANPLNLSYTASATPASSIARFASLVNVIESGSAAPYTYTGNNTSFGTAMGGVATKSRQVGIDGSCAAIVLFSPDANHEVMLGLDDSAAPVVYTSLNHAIFAPATGTYRVINGGASTAATVAMAIAAGDYIRLRVAGTDLFAEVSKDGGATWAIIYTWNAISAASIRYHVQVAKVGALTADQIIGAA